MAIGSFFSRRRRWESSRGTLPVVHAAAALRALLGCRSQQRHLSKRVSASALGSFRFLANSLVPKQRLEALSISQVPRILGNGHQGLSRHWLTRLVAAGRALRGGVIEVDSVCERLAAESPETMVPAIFFTATDSLVAQRDGETIASRRVGSLH